MSTSYPKTADTSSAKKLLTEQEAANYLGVSRSYLQKNRMNRKFRYRTSGPAYCRFGKMIRYTQEALDEWIGRHVSKKNQP